MRVGVGASALVACILVSTALVGEAAVKEQTCTVSDNANMRAGPCKSDTLFAARPKVLKGQQVRVLDRVCPSAEECDDDFGGCWAKIDGGGWVAYEKMSKCSVVKPTSVAPLPVIPAPTPPPGPSSASAGPGPLAAFGGKTLQFIDKEALTWAKCRDACKQRFKGDIVTIENSAQNDAVLSACGARCKGKVNFWIGATKLGNKWKWVNGKTFAEGCEYSYLESPPGAYSAVNGHFRCGPFNCIAYRIDGKVWNNYSCQDQLPCVCLA